MKERLKQLMLSFNGKKALVIGDLMLDKKTLGKASRISPEAPVPVVDILSETYSAGGAGNVAANIQSLSGNASIAGIMGKDEEGVLLLNTLNNLGINTKAVIQDSLTIKKERVIVGTQHILRIDTEPEEGHNSTAYESLKAKIMVLVPKQDAIILSDYGKGTLTKELVLAIIKEAKSIPVIVDAKPEHIEWYHGAKIVSLNQAEAVETAGHKGDWENICKIIAKKTSSAVLITKGKEDTILYDGKITSIPVPQSHFVDKSGAGDTSTAALALAIASGATLAEAVHLANHAASIVISKEGISTVTINEVLAILRHEISNFIRENMEVKQSVIDTQLDKIERLTNYIVDVYKNQKKILIFGNGGSAADAQHFAAELVGRYKMERHGLPAIALTTDTSAITAIANDYSFDEIFSRQVEALANSGDLIVGITTSGNSQNVNLALEKAKKMGCTTVGLCGRDGGKIKDIADMTIIVPSNNTPRIQETHITIIHIVCELLEKEMAPHWRKEVRI